MDRLTDNICNLSSNHQPQELGTSLRSRLSAVLQDRLSRRQLLKAGGLTGISLSALWALACQQATPTVTSTKPAAMATPGAPTPTKPLAATAPAGTPTAEKLGKNLIGKMEGPEIILDSAKYPKTFNEAPILAELVKTGKLPPVKERMTQDLLVIKPLREIGKYGGTWRKGFTGPADRHGGIMKCGKDALMWWDYTATKVMPNTAKGWEVSSDGRVTTVFLRRGLKWSDGNPFTADDIIFWYQDIYQNKDLVSTPTSIMSINGKPITFEKVDAYTVRYKAPDPYYVLPTVLAGEMELGGNAAFGYACMGGYAPAHYLKQFHPKYVSKDDLDKKVKDAKMDNWVSLFKFKNTWHLNSELPAVTPWKTASPANTPTWILERNPYFHAVDAEGNQLPYMDKVMLTLGESIEIINLRAIAGEYDWQARHIDVMKIPVFLQNQQKGNYKLYLDPGDYGSDAQLELNQSYDGDPEIAKWIGTADFRRALSLGIDRDQLNETFWLGLGVPGSYVVVETSPYNPGPEYRTLWSTYDPKKANEMLDKLGLDKKDAEGYRLRTDGKGRLRLKIETYVSILQFTQICEMVREQWKKIGIQGDVEELERSLSIKRVESNEHQVTVEPAWGTENMYSHRMRSLFPVDGGSGIGPLYGKWFASGGTQGKEPPPRMKEALQKYDKSFGVPDDERVKLAKEVWKIAVDEQWVIGLVGLSVAVQGVRVVKNNMGNIPQRQYRGSAAQSPFPSRPDTFFFKS